MKASSLIKYFLLAILVIETSQEWLPQVTGYNKNDANNGYAGIFGRPITGVRVSGGKSYRVHVKGGNWLPAVTGNNAKDSNNGYAGNGKIIDAVAISGGKEYLVHLQGGSWLPPVKGYNINDSNNGYAGILGRPIDAIMIHGRTYAVSVGHGSSGGGGSSQPKSKTAAAAEIYKFFKGKGWSKNAICGLLGNIEVETAYTFNPDIHAYNGDGGYGLLQWTPGSKLRDWAQNHGLNFKTINTQCRRIQYEYENGIQYYTSNYCSLTFRQYIKSNNSPASLAECFMHNYERPNLNYANIPTRRQKATDWCNYF
jgi:hypothetical protein